MNKPTFSDLVNMLEGFRDQVGDESCIDYLLELVKKDDREQKEPAMREVDNNTIQNSIIRFLERLKIEKENERNSLRHLVVQQEQHIRLLVGMIEEAEQYIAILKSHPVHLIGESQDELEQGR